MPVPAPTRTLARIIFGVALLGILVVTHLGLQARTGFANGCTGFGDVTVTAESLTAAPEEGGGCGDVATGEYSTFLGVSNIIWGLGFYIILALLRLGYAANGDRRLRLASFGWVGFGFLYTLRLVYLQAFVIGSFCILCMTSAALVTVLLLLHILEHRRDMSTERHSAPPPSTSAALRPYLAMAGVLAVLLVADVALAGDAPDTPEALETAANADPTETQETPAVLDSPVPEGCAYDPVFSPVVDLTAFTNNPSVGSGAVSVVEVFDPNCPHCQHLHETLRSVKEANMERATFYSVPFPLRPQTNPQAVALAWARDSGHYFDLVEEMFARLDGSWGMSADELRDALNEVDLDGPSLIALLQDPTQSQPLVDILTEDVEAVQGNLRTPDGNISTPKLLINGRVVANTNVTLTEDCLNQMIAEAAGAPAAPAAQVEEIQ